MVDILSTQQTTIDRHDLSAGSEAHKDEFSRELYEKAGKGTETRTLPDGSQSPFFFSHPVHRFVMEAKWDLDVLASRHLAS